MCVCLCLCMLVSQSYLTLFSPMDCSPQAPLSKEFCRQEYWSEMSFPPSGDLLDPGVKPKSPELQGDSLASESPGKPMIQRTVL